jgi:hypothetical protein
MVRGKVAAFAAFAERVGIAMVDMQKNEPELESRRRAACMAFAEAMRISLERLNAEAASTPGLFLVTHQGHKYRVQTARRNDLIVATTIGEVETP